MTAENEVRRRIELRAYAIYEARGGQHGLDEADWLQAEKEVRAETVGPESPVPQGAGPNVPIDSGGVGPKSGEVFPDVDEPGEEEKPLPPPGA